MGDEDMGEETPLEACERDKTKFWGERDEIHRALGVEKQSDAIAEVIRLQGVESDYQAHKCPVCPEIPVIEPVKKIRTGSKEFIRNSKGEIVEEITYKPGKNE